NALRPFRGLGVINLAENAGRSRYNGLQMNLERRSATGLQVGVSYTLSRSRDNASSLTDNLPNAYDDRAYYGISDFDRMHELIMNIICELPLLRQSTIFVSRLQINWEKSGSYHYQSGNTFSVRSGIDFAGGGPGSGEQCLTLAGDHSIARTGFTNAA